MKRTLLPLLLSLSIAGFAQNGYEIKVTFKPFRNQYIYLGHYFGKQYPIIDSVRLDANSQGVFKGNQRLPGGIYLVGYPNKAGFFEMLVDKQQHFTVLADTITIKNGGLQFQGSPDNVLFSTYQRYMGAKGSEIHAAQQQYNKSKNAKDSTRWNDTLTRLDKVIRNYRENIIKNNPDNILTALLTAMWEPEIPGHLKNPKTKADSTESYMYFKTHFWDGVNFFDGRLAYTPFFEEKIDKYYTQLVPFHPDSVIKEIDYMMAFAQINEEMNKFLLLKFVNRYLVQKYMWEDAVFVHLFEKYFASKTYPWLNEKGRKTITDRAYSLMSNIMGTPASEIDLPDTSGQRTALYSKQANYMIVSFWDPVCGHCKEVMPRLDSFYQNKWKGYGLQIFAVARETEGSTKDWKEFISQYQLRDWTHVYYSKADDKSRIDANIPGYSQLYDVQSFPTLYLLDKDKRIIAKKLSVDQIDEILRLKTGTH